MVVPRLFLVIFVIAIIISFSISDAFGENAIPSWFRNNAGWWADGMITGQEFVESVEYLISVGVIDENVTKPSTSTNYENIPNWVKNNAAWWANGMITDSDFASGLQFMIGNGIIGTTTQTPTDITKSFSIEKLPTELGLKVTLTITDSKKHAIVSGSLSDGPDSIFGSGLLLENQSYSFFLTKVGTFEYFDLIRPWASGTITVTSSDLEIYQKVIEQKRIEEELAAAEKEKEIQLLEEITEIRKKYSKNLSGILSLSWDEKDLQEFIGEEKLERYRTIVSDIDTRMLTTDYTIFDSIDLTIEERTLVVEVLQESLQFTKISIKERLEKIEPLLEETEDEINQVDASDEVKSKHISELRDATGEKKAVFVSAMASVIGTIEQELEKKKIELEIEAELLGKEIEPDPSVCGPGTEMRNGQCVPTSAFGGGCLIATATYATELAPQVQQLRELRNNSLLQTESGSAFMESFNQFYYSFSPVIADYERENPIFKEAVKLTITPLLTSLSLLNYVDMNSEETVLGYGISLIILNVGMYFVLPVIVIHRVRKFV